MQEITPENLTLHLSTKHQSLFFPMLQKGCQLPLPGPVSMEEFLTASLGLSEAELIRVQTVFLDGQPVDDLSEANVEAGCEIALSAAMPGALGAVMRRGGFFASMRKDITYQKTVPQQGGGPSFVTVKVFNLLISEIGPVILGQRVFMTQDEMADLAKKISRAGATVRIEGETSFSDGLESQTHSFDHGVWLSVRFLEE